MVSQHNRILALALSAVVIVLLSMQWMLIDFTFAFDGHAGISHIARSLSDLVESPHPEQITPPLFHVVMAVQIVFALAAPVVWTSTRHKRSRIPFRRTKRKTLFVTRTPENNLFVAPLRQWCASPDAHGP